jgi:hypothetical protein
MRHILWLMLAILFGASNAAGNEADRVELATFSSLQPGSELPPEWQPITIARIARQTQYTLTSVDGSTALQAKADASMSSVVRETDIDPHATPWLQWRWRISELNDESDLRLKHGDDFPARIYVFFDYDIMRMSLFDRIVIRIARVIYGNRVPLAALCYVWAKDDPPGTTAWNAYTDRVRMVVATGGADQLNQWVDVERNVRNDYIMAFGEPVPRITGIALATDTDNTGQRSVAWYGDILLAAQAKVGPLRP